MLYRYFNDAERDLESSPKTSYSGNLFRISSKTDGSSEETKRFLFVNNSPNQDGRGIGRFEHW